LQLEQLLFGLVVRPVVRGEYVDCWQQKPRDDDAAGYRNNHTPAAQPAPWPAAQPAAQTAAEPAAQHARTRAPRSASARRFSFFQSLQVTSAN
jgi:hypothetical protein